MSDVPDLEARKFATPAAEMARIMRSGSIWLSAAVIAPGLVLGPLLASGWRPAELPPGIALPFWVGVAIAAVGVGLLVWAGCPILRTDLEQAHHRKVNSIRIGIPLDVAGMALAGLALLLSPA